MNKGPGRCQGWSIESQQWQSALKCFSTSLNWEGVYVIARGCACVFLCLHMCVLIFLCLCLFVCLCVYMSLCISVCLYNSVSICVHVCLHVCMYVYICISVCLCICMSLCVCVCLCMWLYVSVYICLSVYLHISVCVPVCVSVNLCVSEYLSVCTHPLLWKQIRWRKQWRRDGAAWQSPSWTSQAPWGRESSLPVSLFLDNEMCPIEKWMSYGFLLISFQIRLLSQLDWVLRN